VQEQKVTNRIRGPEGNPVDTNSARGVERVRAAASTRPVAHVDQPGGDSVHITATAHAVLALQEAIAEVPDMDTARVSQLQQRIEQQRYAVDAAKIADRLMSLEGDLLAAGQSKKY
jgi:negative regulator of flagellin synthesis FlgM